MGHIGGSRLPGRPRFCLTGTFHSDNRGDCSIQQAAINALRYKWPDAEITLMSSFPDTDQLVYEGAGVARTWRRRPAISAFQLILAGLLRSGAPSRELRTIASSDALIDLSGDGFTEYMGWKCPMSHSIPLLLARLLGTPAFMVAQTIGPFQRHRRYYGRLFSGTAGIFCRDQESILSLAELGVVNFNIHLTADIAFTLEAASRDELLAEVPWLASRSGKPLIGITPSNLFNVMGTDNRKAVLEAMATSARELAASSGAAIVIIPTVFGPTHTGDDRVAAREVAAMIGDGIEVHVVENPPIPRILKALIGQCDLYMSIRMHGLIHALSQGVPSAGIAYEKKAVNLFRRVGIENCILPMADITTASFKTIATQVWNERQSLRATILDSMKQDILPAAWKNIELIAKSLAR